MKKVFYTCGMEKINLKAIVAEIGVKEAVNLLFPQNKHKKPALEYALANEVPLDEVQICKIAQTLGVTPNQLFGVTEIAWSAKTDERGAIVFSQGDWTAYLNTATGFCTVENRNLGLRKEIFVATGTPLSGFIYQVETIINQHNI